MRVAHGRPHLGVAEPCLELDDRFGAADGERAEGVAEVVKADGAEAGALTIGDKPSPERGSVHELAELAGQNTISSSRTEKPGWPRGARMAATSGTIGTTRPWPDFGVVSLPFA
jgi:hypothetical protein